ncbi:hypothetical protein [Dysgonomonas sp. 216]|uniref:hypothetical protein n=1 Tax=Dysgonomonas sp. 216 TaxID=2302934 RepID=UPI001C86E55A|nr:hypothetical protein [Dysgonomonas sp. 216]
MAIKITAMVLSLFFLTADICSQTLEMETCSNEEYQALENVSIPPEQKYLIKENGVDIFLVGQRIPAQTGGYVITKSVETITEEGEDFEILVHTVSENGQEILKIERLFMEADNDADRIDNIFILSDKVKTAEGIGLNSTLDEFIAAYPDFKIWFSYISGIYVIETTKLEGIQFFLDGSDFIDKSGPVFESDMTILKPSEFRKGTKIRRIRIWG